MEMATTDLFVPLHHLNGGYQTDNNDREGRIHNLKDIECMYDLS